jgi:8-oxo-dGTP pyrophosphatase MutT (NUDIX family)
MRGEAHLARVDYYHQPDAPEANSLVPAASAVVINQSGQILLHKRSDNHLWSLPGGTMELGESIEQTILREVYEETGFQVKILRCVGIYSDPHHRIAFSDGEVRQQFSICFACQITGGQLTMSHESTELKFFSPHELQQLDLHPAQRIRLEDYLAQNPAPFIR